jgi:hypothetical protein
LTYEVPLLRAYGYADGEGMSDGDLSLRMLYLDAGLAARPFRCLPALEFRLGAADTYDLRVQHNNRVLGYGAVRLLF